MVYLNCLRLKRLNLWCLGLYLGCLIFKLFFHWLIFFNLFSLNLKLLLHDFVFFVHEKLGLYFSALIEQLLVLFKSEFELLISFALLLFLIFDHFSFHFLIKVPSEHAWEDKSEEWSQSCLRAANVRNDSWKVEVIDINVFEVICKLYFKSIVPLVKLRAVYFFHTWTFIIIVKIEDVVLYLKFLGLLIEKWLVNLINIGDLYLRIP